jgi:hypothetical protein
MSIVDRKLDRIVPKSQLMVRREVVVSYYETR